MPTPYLKAIREEYLKILWDYQVRGWIGKSHHVQHDFVSSISLDQKIFVRLLFAAVGPLESLDLLPIFSTLYFFSLLGLAEAVGSTFYITKDGVLDLSVVLRGLHNISLSETSCTGRVSEVLLCLLSSLLDLGLLAKKGKGQTPPAEVMSEHNMVLDIVVRILRLLGCPHGCGDRQVWPSSEFLRSQCISLLTRYPGKV